MFALLWYIDWSSIRRKLMIVHKTESIASGFSAAFPSCPSEDQPVWILLVSTGSTPGSEPRYLESRDVHATPAALQMGVKWLLVLSANSSFTERSKLSQRRGVIQSNAVLRVRTRLFHFLTTCEDSVCPTSPCPYSSISHPPTAAGSSHSWGQEQVMADPSKMLTQG